MAYFRFFIHMHSDCLSEQMGYVYTEGAIHRERKMIIDGTTTNESLTDN